MTTTLKAIQATGARRAVPESYGSTPEPAPQRGRLVMASRVIEKIVGQAAGEVHGAGGTTGRVLRFGSRTDLTARPKVDVELSGRTATVSVDLAIAYPTPVRQTADRVRTHIIDRVHELTGVEVTRVDIDVKALQSVDQPGTETLR